MASVLHSFLDINMCQKNTVCKYRARVCSTLCTLLAPYICKNDVLEDDIATEHSTLVALSGLESRIIPSAYFSLPFIDHCFNPLLHRYSFQHINNRLLFKTLWEKKKLLITSNFSFSHNVFYSSR